MKRRHLSINKVQVNEPANCYLLAKMKYMFVPHEHSVPNDITTWTLFRFFVYKKKSRLWLAEKVWLCEQRK